MIWGFFGNISVSSATETATKARDVLGLNLVKREHLLDFRIVSLPAGEQRLDFDVEDQKNENSCLVSYFQQGAVESSEIQESLLTELTIQFLDEPTFNQLRTIEQLGYVVFTRANVTRDVHGV